MTRYNLEALVRTVPMTSVVCRSRDFLCDALIFGNRELGFSSNPPFTGGVLWSCYVVQSKVSHDGRGMMMSLWIL
jgi:hypothetical protein